MTYCADPINDVLRFGCAHLTPNLVYNWTGLLVVFDASTGTVTQHPFTSPSNPHTKVFGDREVFGLADDKGVHLWFFNPSFVPNHFPGL